MILSTHFLAGAAVAAQTDNPAVLMITVLVVHLLLDILPHWQYFYALEELKKNKAKLLVDIVAGPAAVLVLALVKYGLDFPIIFWLMLGGLISVLPDGVTFLFYLFPKNKTLRRITDFHEWIQGKRRFAGPLGFAFTLLVDLAAIYLIVLPKA